MNKKSNVVSEETLKKVTGGIVYQGKDPTKVGGLLDPEFALRGKKEDTAEGSPKGERTDWMWGD